MLFSNKKTKLWDAQTSTSATDNSFLNTGMKESSKTTSGNGSLKFNTTGDEFIDQFASLTRYRDPRDYKDIDYDMKVLWSISPVMTIMLTFYIRMITRITKLASGLTTSTVQRGQGLKHEGIMRMMWISIHYPDSFWKNITLYIAIASWKDIFKMLQYDLIYNGWDNKVLDWDGLAKVIIAGLENPNTNNLVKKYLPQIKAKSKATTVEAQANVVIAKYLSSKLFGKKMEDYSHYKSYRKVKSSGTAHSWQQLISQRKFLELDFDSIHGRALSQLVSSKFLANQGLEQPYEKWISEKPIAKFTGYVYELFKAFSDPAVSPHLKSYQSKTINAQFMQLVETAKKDMNTNTKFITVIDSSYSMTSTVPGTQISAYGVAKSMALYFSYLLEGTFNKHFIEFASTSVLKQWKGDNPVDNMILERSSVVGSTNFQTIGDLFGRLKKEGVPESEFPTGILCISDGEFNRTGGYYSLNGQNDTNFDALLEKLESYGFSKSFVDNFKVILWDVPNNHYGESKPKFEDYAGRPNLFHVSGLDGSIVSFITGNKHQTSTPKSTAELYSAAMNQEILTMVEE